MTPNPIFNWFFGPQIIGVIYLLIGAIQYRFPPKKINNLYGYRMPSAQKNQETWDEANRYSAAYMIKTGIFLIVAGLVFSALIINIDIPLKTKQILTVFLVMASAIGSALVMIV